MKNRIIIVYGIIAMFFVANLFESVAGFYGDAIPQIVEYQNTQKSN